MSGIALKFIAAGVIALGLLCVSLAIGAGWSFIRSAPGGSRHHPDRKNHDHRKRSLDRG